jgi:glycosidase
METLRENYPHDCYYSLMNALGTHDTPRILTVLGTTDEEWAKGQEEHAVLTLPPERRALAVRRLKLAAAVLYTFPGSPCVYYGDEAGLEGFGGPFTRRGYPWGSEDKELISWYKKLGSARNSSEALRSGDIHYRYAKDGLLVYERTAGDDRVTVCANRSFEPAVWTNGALSVHLGPVEVKILKRGAVWI